MQKSDLKTGMLLEFSNGNFGIVLKDTEKGDVIASERAMSERIWGELSSFNEDLTYHSTKASYFDIVKVYSCSKATCEMLSFENPYMLRTLIWERK